MAPHSSTLAWKIPWTEEPGRLHVHGIAKSRTRLSDFTFTFHLHASEKEMATHPSVLAWRIPGMGEPGGLPSMRLHRVGDDWSDSAVAAAVQQLYVNLKRWEKNNSCPVMEGSDHFWIYFNCLGRSVHWPGFPPGGRDASLESFFSVFSFEIGLKQPQGHCFLESGW